MHLGRKWIYGCQRIYISRDGCRVWPKTVKIQDGRKQNILKKKYLIIISEAHLGHGFLFPVIGEVVQEH